MQYPQTQEKKDTAYSESNAQGHLQIQYYKYSSKTLDHSKWNSFSRFAELVEMQLRTLKNTKNKQKPIQHVQNTIKITVKLKF